MTKLLDAYRNLPSLKNAGKIRAYDRKHPMTRCVLDSADADLLADAIHHANAGVWEDQFEPMRDRTGAII